jgi:tetratricopeptide (TPR) repeat protein
MTDDLYERYKEALRLGHVAVLKGALEEALEAYRLAASIAPSRALPHTSLGGVLLRLGHLEEALVEYASAVARAPHDEGALLGQAEALATAGQRVDAAQALDHVAEIQEAAGRLPEAADTLRRALEMDEAPERARHQRGLLREIRLSAGDQAAEQLLARALRLRDEPHGATAETKRAEGAVAALGTVPARDPVPPRNAATALGTVPALDPVPRRTAATALIDVATAADASRRPADTGPDEPLVLPVRPATAGPRRPVEPAWPESDFRAAAQLAELRQTLSPDGGDSDSASARHEASDAARAADEWPAADFAGRTSPGSRGSEHGSAEAAAPARSSEAAAVPRSAAGGAAPEIDTTSSEVVDEPAVAGARAVVYGQSAAAPESVLATGGLDEPFDAAVPVGVIGESQQQPTGDELLVAAEAADLNGDSATLRSLLLWTARAYAREGRFDAGLDATHRLLQKVPDDVDAHLVLVELYMARDWTTLAADKLALLGRLAELNDDEATRQRLCAVASRAFPNDARLGTLCS